MAELAKNQRYTARVESFNSQGHGVCRIGDRAVFLPGAIPGELWELLILKVTASAVYAKGLHCLEASEHRCIPPCPAYGKCGGCALLHMNYSCECDFKRGRVDDAFAHIAKLDLRVEEFIPAKERFHYRNKAIYAVGDGATGFFRPRSHDIIPVESCLLQSSVADRAAFALRRWMTQHRIPAYDETTGRGCVRHLFVRTSRLGGAVVCVVSAAGLGSATASLAEAMTSECPELTGVVLNINKTRGNTVLAGDFYTLWGSAELESELSGFRFQIAPQAFFQVNPDQAEQLYAKAVKYAAADGETVLELYCGAGTISLCLARTAAKVIGAEISEPAVINARGNAERNGVKNVEFICADASDAADELLKRGLKPYAVVVDPPRKGLAGSVIDCIAEMGPQRVVYVSCDPATLARDIAKFSALGYAPKRAAAVDMFPCTAHVETVVLLSKLNTKQHIEVELNLDELDLTAAESKATDRKSVV